MDTPCPKPPLKLAKEADAVLFGAVGDWKYDKLERRFRPEQAILGLRKNLGLFANFRPAICYEQLVGASSLKPELIAGLDILIIRELTGDIYFGQPRGRRIATDGHFPGAEEAFDTMRYSRPEIERIAHVAFQAAQKRNKRVTSVDKNNVLETSQLWKDVMVEVGQQYPDVELDHMLVDNAAMQLVKAPKKFDVLVTGQHVRRHPVRRSLHAHRLHRHAAFCQLEQQQPGPVRTQPRQRTGHRRQRHCQPVSHHPECCHDVAFQPEPGSCRPAYRSRCEESTGARFAHSRHLQRRLHPRQHQRDGRRGAQGPGLKTARRRPVAQQAFAKQNHFSPRGAKNSCFALQ